MKISTNPRVTSYRFTVNSLDDQYLLQLKQQVANTREEYRKNRREFTSNYPSHSGKEIQLPYVRIRARGPRKNQFSKYHTLMKNATHYDIYVQNRLVKVD